jgi:hypothetical protein
MAIKVAQFLQTIADARGMAQDEKNASSGD